ncbi:hypothetical protein MtrunA17_Chr4g0026431 [Medicago truncatula]|uniref:Transmembrane protein n=1 Tax=Medicago truncatula TaxID=3880 RepID=A0A396I8C9_MEDTR|nr:hypothetical protein MtrunA17_Chr4g0026431 [Medicago truncatula]
MHHQFYFSNLVNRLLVACCIILFAAVIIIIIDFQFSKFVLCRIPYM